MAELPFNDSLISIIFYQRILEAFLAVTDSPNLQGKMEILWLDFVLQLSRLRSA